MQSQEYRDCFSSWLSPWFGQQDISCISRVQILDMHQAMMNGRPSVSRQYGVIMCLKSLMKFCRGALALSCLDPTDITWPKRRAPQVEFLSNEEIQRMLNAIDTGTFSGTRLRALIESCSPPACASLRL